VQNAKNVCELLGFIARPHFCTLDSLKLLETTTLSYVQYTDHNKASTGVSSQHSNAKVIEILEKDLSLLRNG